MIVTVLLVIAAMIVSTPIAAALLVSIASTREDSAHSLGRPAPGPARAAARRLLAFHADGIGRPAAPRALAPDPAAGQAEAPELAGASR